MLWIPKPENLTVDKTETERSENDGGWTNVPSNSVCITVLQLGLVRPGSVGLMSL